MDIETAPPLGSRTDVIASIVAIAPEMTFNERGVGVATGDGYSLSIDVGPRDPVAAAVANAEGELAVALLREILETCSWRGYLPKLGAFVDASRVEDLARERPRA